MLDNPKETQVAGPTAVFVLAFAHPDRLVELRCLMRSDDEHETERQGK